MNKRIDECDGCFLSDCDCDIKHQKIFCPCKECLCKITCRGFISICEDYRISLELARDSREETEWITAKDV